MHGVGILTPFYLNMVSLQIPEGKKVYCISDMHLGFPNATESRFREMQLISWMDQISGDASDLFLVGDIFDFWFEYKRVVPKGFVRFLGKVAALADHGVRIHVFVGNHDLWMKDYFIDECQAAIYRTLTDFEFRFTSNSVRVCIGHGDGIGPGDYGYKVLKQVFVNPVAQILFRYLHPDWGVKLAHWWSGTRKSSVIKSGEVAFNPETDFIVLAVKERIKLDQLADKRIQAYICGHRHHAVSLPMASGVMYYNLGEWFSPEFKQAHVLEISEEGFDFGKFQPIC
jgi:UDP-2,3-diacylglucosamine hydrolase